MVLIHVKRMWLSLPLIIPIFSLIFLVATIRRTMRDVPKVGVWKNNIMAILQNGLGNDVQRALRPETNIGEVSKKAGRNLNNSGLTAAPSRHQKLLGARSKMKRAWHAIQQISSNASRG